MYRTTGFHRRPERNRRALNARLQVERLETRDLLSGLTVTPLVQVSSTSPFDAAFDAGQSGTVYPDSEVEPQVAVDPLNAQHVVGVWQQDRWSNGGARGLVAGVSTDGGNTWTRVVVPGLSLASGGAYARASDPWVSFAPDGGVYVTSLSTTLAGPFPSRSAILVSKSDDGGFTWGAPTTLIDDTSPFPKDELNDKEAVTADPTDPTGRTAYVVWDRIQLPSDQANLEAFHSFGFRENIYFSRTTDGGATWEPARNLTNFKANESGFGSQIVVEPDGTLVDVFTLLNGSGSQKPQADQNVVAVIRSTDHGVTWSDPVAGPAEEVIAVTDPDNGKPVRDGDPLLDVTVDPHNGNLYAAWVDGRFSNFAHDDIAFSMSADGGRTWSDPIKINQTPSDIPAGNQQAFTPSVAVAADGTVAVTYYDFRNNTADPGLPTDYWIVHADSAFTSPGSWTSENRLTDTSFNLENAPVARGFFVGDYQGLAVGGADFNSFYAFFAQAGTAGDPSSIFFRDPPPEGANAAGRPAPAAVAPSGTPAAPGTLTVDVLAALGAGSADAPRPQSRAAERSSAVGRLPPATESVGPVSLPAAPSGDGLRSGGGGGLTEDGDALLDAVFSDGWGDPIPPAG
jgi:hypothetical protein